MSLDVFYVECSEPFWLGVAERLAAEAGWRPRYWTASPALADSVAARLPRAVFHSNLDAIRSRPAQGLDVVVPPLDLPLLERLAFHQVETLQMMDRMDDAGSFPYQERMRLYHRIARYWLGVLDHFRPDLVIFATTPHLVYDYVLYVLCRDRGVKTVMFETTKMRGLMFPTEGWEEHTELLATYAALCREHAGVGLAAETEGYLRSIGGRSAERPAFLDPLYRYRQDADEPRPPRPGTTGSLPSRVYHTLKWWASRPYRMVVPEDRTVPPNYIKQRGRTPETSFVTRRAYWAMRRRVAVRMSRLEAYYEALARPADLTQPFVYLALNFQPERTTSPMGGAYVDQRLVVQMVAQSLPAGWRLYVKEHPKQFFSSIARVAQSCRSRTFYDDLAAVPGVQLVSMAVASLDLVDHARAVANVNGTVGWEAINRAKPAIVFGYPWYRGCEGVFHVRDAGDCREAMARVAAGYAVDPTRVKLFAQAIERTSVRGYVDSSYQRVVGVSEADNIVAVAEALRDFCQRVRSSASPTTSAPMTVPAAIRA